VRCTGLSAACLAGVLLAATAGRGQTSPGPASRTVLATGVAAPLGFVGDEVAVRDGAGIVALGRGTRRRLLADHGIRGATASADVVAVVHSNVAPRGIARSIVVDVGRPKEAEPQEPPGPRAGARPGDRTELLAGPPGGALHRVLRCTGSASVAPEDGPQPVASGSGVAWSGCDRRSVVLDSGGAQRVLPADGYVIALALAGRRLGWIAARAGRTPPVLHLLDLDRPEEATVTTLGPTFVDSAELVLAADGRAVARVNRDDGTATFICRGFELAAGQAAPATLADGPCSTVVAFLASGALRVAAAPQKPTVLELSRTGADGVVHPLVGGRLVAPSYAVDGDRVATLRQTCRSTELALEPEAPAAPVALPACPLVLGSGDLHATEAGAVDIAVRCPASCRVMYASLSGRRVELGAFAAEDRVVRAGDTTHFTLRLDAVQRRTLRRRHRVGVTVLLSGNDLTFVTAMRTLVAPRLGEARRLTTRSCVLHPPDRQHGERRAARSRTALGYRRYIACFVQDV